MKRENEEETAGGGGDRGACVHFTERGSYWEPHCENHQELLYPRPPLMAFLPGLLDSKMSALRLCHTRWPLHKLRKHASPSATSCTPRSRGRGQQWPARLSAPPTPPQHSGCAGFCWRQLTGHGGRQPERSCRFLLSLPFPLLWYFISCSGGSVHKDNEKVKLHHVVGGWCHRSLPTEGVVNGIWLLVKMIFAGGRWGISCRANIFQKATIVSTCRTHLETEQESE